MTPEEREHLKTLCKQIQDEKDHEKFTQLVIKLNDLVDRKEKHSGPRLRIEVQLKDHETDA